MEHYSIELKIESAEDKGADKALTEANYTGTVTSDNEKGYIIAVTSNGFNKDQPNLRVITAQMVAVPNAPEENKADAGVWTKTEEENSVQAILLDHDGKELASSAVVIYE